MDMDILYRGYVPTKNKRPVEKFRNKDVRTFDDIKDLPEYAGVLERDIILIDIDDMKQSEIMMNIVEDQQINCVVYKTSRGRHFLFRNTDVNSASTHIKLACGLTADIKLGSRNGLEVIKFDGKERFVEWEPEGNDLDYLPKWMKPIKTKMDFVAMEPGDGRNQSLFNYILVLSKAGFTKEESRGVLKLINDYVFDVPVSSSELEVITRDEAFPKYAFFDENGTFQHNQFAQFMKNEESVIHVNGVLHIYLDGVYRSGNNAIENAMIKHIPTLKSNQRTEVIKYLDLIAEEKPEADARYIAFNNGVYDITEDVLKPFERDFVIINKIPWDYKKGAYSELCDKTLDKIACHDKQIRMLLEEAIGYPFYRRNELSKAFFLTGEGSNGKSTFLDMLKNLLSQENVSALDLEEMIERFSSSSMSGKLANIADDISDEFLKGRQASTYRKIVSGNQIKGEFKGDNVFFFSPYIKLYNSANALPRTPTKTFKAMLRRMIIIPFNAEFSENDPDFDPYIGYKLKDREVMEYLIQIGIEGLKRVLKNHRFTKSDKVDKELKDYEIVNNPILSWLDQKEQYEIDNQPTAKVYRSYRLFCVENGFQEMTQINFSRELCRRCDLKTKSVRIDKERVQIFVKEENKR